MAARKGRKQQNKSAQQLRQEARDRVFPERTMTAREEGAVMAAAREPKRDWRPELQARFAIDGNLTQRDLDGFDPGEPDRYDYSDMQEAHALAHVPLWKIDASQVKLLFDYGYATDSVFRLGLLMAEEDPFLFVEGSVFGELLPALASQIGQEYDPVTDKMSFDSEETAFRYKTVCDVLQRAEDTLTDPTNEIEDCDVDLFRRARAIAAGPKRMAMVEADVSVVERRRGGLRVVPTPGSDGGVLVPPADIEADLDGMKTRKRRVAFYIIGVGDEPSYASAFDSSGRPIQCDAYMGHLDLDESKAGLQTLYGISARSWTDFD